ncbi:MAG: hypothetical protein ACPLRP_06720, partial [Candidatus Bipolaricaulaceae bacterium]
AFLCPAKALGQNQKLDYKGKIRYNARRSTGRKSFGKGGLMRRGILGFLLLGFWAAAWGISFYGDWDVTINILPTPSIYGSTLHLNVVFAPGWRVESETEIYSGGVYKYQNFYISGSFGDFSVWGKMYFSAEEVRYQKMWLNAEIPLLGGTFRSSFNHWATPADYSSTDRDMFGDWPCYTLVPADPVIEATAEWVDGWQGPTDPRIGSKAYIHGTIVAYYRTGTYVNLYMVRNHPDKRFIIYIRFADIPESTVLAKLGITSWTEVVGMEVCVYGTLRNWESPSGVHNPEIILAESPNKVCDLNKGQCQPTMVPVAVGPFINWRFTYTLDPWKLTVDFGDCCTGFSFRKLSVEAKGLSLCCGLFYDATLSFTKSGFEKISFSVGDLYFPCCGITSKFTVDFTTTSKTVKLEPSWRGLAGCFTVYGDVNFSGTTLGGIVLYGWDITCYTDSLKVRMITALDPDKVEDITDITFYTGEWEYISLTYTAPGCCGGDVKFTLEAWFGSRGTIFDLQRFEYDFEVPVIPTFSLTSDARWDFSYSSPLRWMSIGWKTSF